MIKIKWTPELSNHLADNDYSLAEQAKIYDDQLADLLLNTRWYLDNLDFLPTYRVSWKNYSNNRPTVPYKYTLKGKDL